MYNAFLVRKKTIQAQQIRKKSQQNKRYVDRYYNIARPALLDSHNKKINSFIRRMEEQPIQINLDPYRKKNEENQMGIGSKFDKRSFSSTKKEKRQTLQTHTWRKTLHQQGWKFKNNEDWKSLLTPFQRIERKKNYELFKQKYGDPQIAYRSIGSQSEYKPGHQFRERDKSLEINPPMKYTNKPTKQILAKLKNRLKNKKKENIQKNAQQSKNYSGGQSRDEDFLGRRNNTASSFSGINQDNLLSENTDKISKWARQAQKQALQQNENSKNPKEKKQFKLHFKQLMDLEQNITDFKTKKALREILYKCGVYRRKNRRVATDSQTDQLSQFTDLRDR